MVLGMRNSSCQKVKEDDAVLYVYVRTQLAQDLPHLRPTPPRPHRRSNHTYTKDVASRSSSIRETLLLVVNKLLQRMIERPTMTLVETVGTLAVRKPDAGYLANGFDVVLGGQHVA